MLIILLLFFLGVLLGSSLKRLNIKAKTFDTLLELSTYGLLIFLGVMVGTNERILLNVYQIGFKAFIITAVTLFFSILFAFSFYKKYHAGHND